MTNSISKAMILAAGEGTRLRPLTIDTPKPLLPVNGIPLLIRQLYWLKRHGIDKVAVNLHHLGEKIQSELGNGSSFGIEIRYSPEETLLGTAGGVKKMEAFFDDTFFVIYGDNLTDADLTEMTAIHKSNNAFATVALFRHPRPWEVGIVEMDETDRIIDFIEKPPRGTEKSDLCNAGIYIFEPEIFSYIPDAGHPDFGYDVFPKVLADNKPVYGYTLGSNEYLIDIGTIEKYRQAQIDVASGKVKLYGAQ